MWHNNYMKKRALFIILILPLVLMASTPIDKGWQYLWGDSPRDESGHFVYMSDSPPEAWSEIGYPSNPPERSGRNNVWFRYTLPENLPPDPAMYIFSIDNTVQVYVDHEQIYAFGTFDENGQSVFEGWPWHLIGLPEEAAGKTVYFRVFSDSGDIGLWGELSLVGKSEQLTQILNSGFTRFLIGSVVMAMSLLFFILFLSNVKNREYLYLGLLVFTQGLDLTVSSQVRQLFFDYPLLAQYTLAFCYFFFPVGVGLFMEHLIGSGYLRIIRRIWQIHLAYLVGALGLALIGAVSLSNTYGPFDSLYYSVTAPVMLLYAGIIAIRGNMESRLLFVGYAVLVLFYFYSTAIAAGWISWDEYPTHYAVFFFLIVLTLIAYRKMVKGYQEIGKMQALLVQQAKSAKLGEMLNVITHQWKQPLTAISLVSGVINEYMQEQTVDREQIRICCGKIEKQIAFMSRTIEDFKQFFNPRKVHKEIQINDLLDTVVGILDSKYKYEAIDIRYPQENLSFKTIPNELNQVLLNLIDNAKDALVVNKPTSPFVQIRCRNQNKMIVIEVEDNGGGIDSKIIDTVFDAYVTSKGEGGSGVGLYMCKLIVEESLKGTIEATNTESGVRFTIRLPDSC